jgi:hypothetical protein
VRTKVKVLLSFVAIIVVAGAIWVVGARRRAASAGWALVTPASSNGASSPLGKDGLPRGLPLLAPIGTPIPEKSENSGEPVQAIHDSKEYAQKIAESDAFRSFASRAKLDADGQHEVSHIVALYYMDDASLVASSFDNDKLVSMRRQLLRHMDARVRAKIPQATWDDFEQSKLLPSGEPGANGPT